MYKTLAGEIIADEVADQQVRAANALLVHAGPLIKADLPLRCGYTRCGRILRGHRCSTYQASVEHALTLIAALVRRV